MTPLPPAPGIETILAEAVEIAPEAARRDYLDRACGGDAALRARVDRLVAAHLRAGDFLKGPAAGLEQGETALYPQAGADGGPGLGSRVGPYTLREVIGEGGMGLVFVAEQSSPVRRKVALKVIKPGMDSRQVVARFEAERQALALMDHPNIATVLDAGATDEGRPYFVMELVKGVTLTDYCDANRLPVRGRLGLFLQVCAAVQHAHQKGVIHRDLKPSNVLVTVHDGAAVVKVIDFGVAKAVGAALTDGTLDTGLTQLVGTPVYMSPEQAGGGGRDVDTRADVYALGVVLYELLTGTTPFEGSRLRSKGLEEFRRAVREEEPARPSERLSTLDATARSTLADRRGADPRRLTGEVRRDLDWVAMRCLEKDRERRYESAAALAADVRRYLADEPVEARRPTAGYRLRKFVRRNRPQVIAGGLVVVTLVGGVIGTTLGLVRANRAAEAERQARLGAVKQQERAEQAAEAERIARLDAVEQRELAERAADQERRAKLDADAKRREAERNLAFAKKGNDILGSVFEALNPQADYKAVADLRNALRDNLTKAVRDLEGSALGDPREVAAMQERLGLSLLGLGDAPLAIEVLQKALGTNKALFGPDHPSTLANMNNLARTYRYGGQFAKAVLLHEQAMERMNAKLGPDHPSTLANMGNLASAYRAGGQLAKAVPLFEQAMEGMKAKLGPDHPSTLNSMNNLATSYAEAKQGGKAVVTFATYLEGSRKRLPKDDTQIAGMLAGVSLNLLGCGQYEAAEPLLRECLALRDKLQPDDYTTFNTRSMLGGSLLGQMKYVEAKPLLHAGYEGLAERVERIPPQGMVRLYEAADRLAQLYAALGQPDEAARWRANRDEYPPPSTPAPTAK